MNRTRATFVLAIAACGGPSTKTAVAPSSPAPATPVAPNDDVAELRALSRGPGLAEFPQADAVIGLDRDDITYAADGTVTRHHHSIVKLLDAQRGKEKFADVHIPFDSKRQTLDLMTTRTLTATGAVFKASADEITDIVPPHLADAAMYSDVRERVVSFPAVDTGSVVELEYTKTTKASPTSALGGELLLGHWDPVVRRVVTITSPTSMTPKLAVERSDVAVVETIDAKAGTHTYSYTLTNLPDRHEEAGRPEDSLVLPRVVFGFRADWPSAIAPIVASFASARPTPTVIDVANRVVARARTQTDRAQALYSFVAHDIRSVEIPLGASGYEPTSLDEVLANRYADTRDKAALLVGLLAAVKLPATPVLIRTQSIPVIASVPTVTQFDRVVVKTHVDGKDVWLDPEDFGQYGMVFGGPSALALPIDAAATQPVAFTPMSPGNSVSRITATMKLGPNGDLDAQYNYELTGVYARTASEHLRALKGDNQARFFASQAGAVAPGATDKGHSVGDTLAVAGPLAIKQRLGIPGYSAMQGNFRLLEIPSVPLGALASNLPPALQTERTQPMVIGSPRTMMTDISVQVPAGWKVAYVPPTLEGSVKGIKYNGSCSTKGTLVSCHDEVTVEDFVVPSESYAGYRDAMAKLHAYERRVVILTK